MHQCLYAAETVAAYYVGIYKGLTIAPMTGEEREALYISQIQKNIGFA